MTAGAKPLFPLARAPARLAGKPDPTPQAGDAKGKSVRAYRRRRLSPEQRHAVAARLGRGPLDRLSDPLLGRGLRLPVYRPWASFPCRGNLTIQRLISGEGAASLTGATAGDTARQASGLELSFGGESVTA